MKVSTILFSTGLACLATATSAAPNGAVELLPRARSGSDPAWVPELEIANPELHKKSLNFTKKALFYGDQYFGHEAKYGFLAACTSIDTSNRKFRTLGSVEYAKILQTHLTKPLKYTNEDQEKMLRRVCQVDDGNDRHPLCFGWSRPLQYAIPMANRTALINKALHCAKLEAGVEAAVHLEGNPVLLCVNNLGEIGQSNMGDACQYNPTKGSTESTESTESTHGSGWNGLSADQKFQVLWDIFLVFMPWKVVA